MTIKMDASVGHGGINKAADVRKIKQRMSELGFEFFRMNGSADPGLLIAIKLYQSIIKGYSRVGHVDGRVDPGGFTLSYLNSRNSPQWQLMPDDGPGYINHELKDELDNHDYGTSWMAKVIKSAGQSYKRNYLANSSNASLISINDVSLEHGHDTRDHSGHETGLSCDLRLPRIDGGYGGISNPNTNRSYDREAMRAQLMAIRAQPNIRQVLFNDDVLVAEGLCKRAAGHGNHVHFDLEPLSA